MIKGNWYKYSEIRIKLKKGRVDGPTFEVDGREPKERYPGPAVYGLYLIGKPMPRFLASDAHGTLIVGQASNLDRRFYSMIRGIQTCSGHSESNLINLLLWKSSKFRDHIAGCRLVFWFTPTDKSDLNRVERAELHWYLHKFGELPPLNSAIPGRYHAYKDLVD